MFCTSLTLRLFFWVSGAWPGLASLVRFSFHSLILTALKKLSPIIGGDFVVKFNGLD